MELSDYLIKINEFKGQIEAIGKFDEGLLNKIQYKFRLDWNYYSNKMEGGTLTRQETRSVMVGNITIGGKPFKDVMEMKGHNTIISEILKIGFGEIRISEKRIKEIHAAIMHEDIVEQAKLIGKWKETPNEVINYRDEKFSFAQPFEVPEKMHNLLNNTNASLNKYFKFTDEIHPLIIASDFHIDYLTIHPFYDGNGRTARILTNLILISCGYPPIIIKENEKNTYYQYLADIQIDGGDRSLLYAFFADKLIQSQQLILDAYAGIDIEEPDDVRKEIELLRKKLAHKDFTKSPSNIYQTYLNVEKEVWLKVSETLKNFNEFFSESTTSRYVNHQEEKYGTHNIFALTLGTTSSKPKNPKIFGHDIYDGEINIIEWKHQKLGLKGATKNYENKVFLLLNFYHDSYNMNLYVDHNNVFTKKYQFGTIPTIDEVETMRNTLGKSLVKAIKENTLELE
jgi:Fic family protein